MAGSKKYLDLRYMFMRGLIKKERQQRRQHYLKSSAECTSRAIVSLELAENTIKSVNQASKLQGIGGEIKKRLSEIQEEKSVSQTPPVKGKFVSSAGAILLTLLEEVEKAISQGHSQDRAVLVAESTLKKRARELCEEELLDDSIEGGFCQAWRRIDVLIKRDLVKRRSLKKQNVYQLLPLGQEAAEMVKGHFEYSPEEVYAKMADAEASSQNCPGTTTATTSGIHGNENFLYTTDTGDDGVILVIDRREWGGDRVGLGELCRLLDRHQVKYRSEHLSVGDYSWVWRSENTERRLPHLVERKRADDLAGSLMDGRFWKQINKMLEWKKEFTTRGIPGVLYYIVEGDPKSYVVKCADGCQGVGRCGNPTLSEFKCAFNDLSSVSELTVHTTDNIQSTVLTLASLTSDLQQRVNKGDFDYMVAMEIDEVNALRNGCDKTVQQGRLSEASMSKVNGQIVGKRSSQIKSLDNKNKRKISQRSPVTPGILATSESGMSNLTERRGISQRKGAESLSFRMSEQEKTEENFPEFCDSYEVLDISDDFVNKDSQSDVALQNLVAAKNQSYNVICDTDKTEKCENGVAVTGHQNSDDDVNMFGTKSESDILTKNESCDLVCEQFIAKSQDKGVIDGKHKHLHDVCSTPSPSKKFKIDRVDSPPPAVKLKCSSTWNSSSKNVGQSSHNASPMKFKNDKVDYPPTAVKLKCSSTWNASSKNVGQSSHNASPKKFKIDRVDSPPTALKLECSSKWNASLKHVGQSSHNASPQTVVSEHIDGTLNIGGQKKLKITPHRSFVESTPSSCVSPKSNTGKVYLMKNVRRRSKVIAGSASEGQSPSSSRGSVTGTSDVMLPLENKKLESKTLENIAGNFEGEGKQEGHIGSRSEEKILSIVSNDEIISNPVQLSCNSLTPKCSSFSTFCSYESNTERGISSQKGNSCRKSVDNYSHVSELISHQADAEEDSPVLVCPESTNIDSVVDKTTKCLSDVQNSESSNDSLPDLDISASSSEHKIIYINRVHQVSDISENEVLIDSSANVLTVESTGKELLPFETNGSTSEEGRQFNQSITINEKLERCEKVLTRKESIQTENVQLIKTILPHLSPATIERALLKHSGNVDNCISSLLDENSQGSSDPYIDLT